MLVSRQQGESNFVGGFGIVSVEQPLGFSLDPLVGKAVTLQGSFSHTYATWERALRLLSSGQINLTRLGQDQAFVLHGTAYQ